MRRVFAALLLAASVSSAQAATYYISPTGSNANAGTSSGAPWLTFAHAINASRAWCGDTLVLLDGTYGDGTSTGKLSINGVTCTLGDELTITAQNERQAKISDNGTGYALRVQNSAYLVIEGLYVRSVDNNYLTTTAELGEVFYVETSNHITARRNLSVNPNRYGNNHAYVAYRSQDVLFEDNEAYIFGRHCVSAGESQRVTVRRQYCNPRGGKISGGFSAGGAALGSGDAVMSMYPCTDCILENSIADGTESPTFLNEMNANYGFNVVMSGAKVVGSVCYRCGNGNAVFPNGRSVADLNHTPQNLVIRDVAIVNQTSPSAGVKCQDCVNATLDHITVLADATTPGATGIQALDSTAGGTAAQNSIFMTNILVAGLTGSGFSIAGHNTWSGDEVWSNGNGTAFSPALPSNWTNTSTAAHGMGACKLWVPSGAAVKGVGTGGSDIGATILYRYVDGVLTTTPLWDPVTGEFPHGAADPDGVNRVAGASIHDVHQRLNVNTNGCSFPAGYGGSAPTNPSTIVSSTNLTGSHVHVIDSGMDSLTVGVAVYWADYLNTETAFASGVTSSCGSEAISALEGAVFTPSGDRTARVFGKINPTSGTCTLTPTFNSANWTGWVMTSVEKDGVGSYGTVARAAGLSSTPSVTASVNNDHTIIDFMATSNVPTISSGAHQILTTDRVHSTAVLRQATSEQSGTNGGVMDWSLSSARGWIEHAVPLIPPSPGGGSGSTFRLTKYRIDSLHGTLGAPEVTLGALAAQDAPAKIGTTGSARIRAEVLIETATSTVTGTALYCKKNAGSFARAMNTFGSNVFRLYGPGSEPTIPATLTPTTQRFTGTFVPGFTVRDDSLPVILPAIAANSRTELDYQLVLGNGAVAGDTVQCEIRRDDGSTLGTHTVTPQIDVVGAQATMGF